MDRRRQSEFDRQSIVDADLLKQHIKGRLQHFVDTSIDLSFDDGKESQKQELVERLRSSESFRRWKSEVLQSEIEFISASANPSRNLSRAVAGEQQSASYSIEHIGGYYTSTLPSLDSQNDDDDESQQPMNSGLSFALTGTLSASTFAFMGRNYLKHVVEVLTAPMASTEDDATMRYETVQALAQLSASDMCESEYWSEFKDALRKLLADASGSLQWRLSDAVLRFLVKLFNSSSHNVTVDAIGLLADHLKEDVFGSKPIRFIVKDGRLRFDEDNGPHILLKLRVLDEMCQGFAKVLPRYSQQHAFQVAEKMVALLEPATENEDGSVFTSFLAWAIIDSKMKWWQSWMHGRLGRTAILAALDKHWSAVDMILNIALNPEIRNAGDPLQESGQRLSYQEVSAASRMVESLLLYHESRRLLGKHSPSFPDEHLDRLLTNAVSGGPFSKFAWKIAFALVMNAHGRCVFFDVRRLRRIAKELISKDLKYPTKIKLLQLIAELLKSCDYSADTMARMFDHLLEHRDGQATFCQHVMAVISDFITSAYSRDPDAPLSLVYACFDACAVLCRSQAGRRLVSERPQFLIHAIKLVKEHSVEVGTLLPILVSISVKDTACDAVMKKFLAVHASRLDRAHGSSPLLWHRPAELHVSVVQSFAIRLKDLRSKIAHVDDSEALDRLLAPYRHQFFLILCHPEGNGLLLQNDVFMQMLLDPFRDGEDFQESPLTDFSLRLLMVALCRADFLLGVRCGTGLIQDIVVILTSCYSSDECGEATDSADTAGPKVWIQNAFSTRLMTVYTRLRYLGGPNERLGVEPELTILDELLNDTSKCFSSEPSRFIVRPVTGASSLAEWSEEEPLVKFFIGCVERKKRVQYSEILLQAIGGLQSVASTGDGTGPNPDDDIVFYETVLDYGKNLGILDRESASSGLRSFLRGIYELTGSSTESPKGVDWFAAVVLLIFGGNSEKALEFLRKFSQVDAVALKCVWAKMSSGSDFASLVVEEITPVLDTILERELPRVQAALIMHGITASSLVTFWLNQCFVNVLDWPEICNYVTLAVIGGPKYQAFFCGCLCYQMADQICVRAHDQNDNGDLHSFLLGPMPFKLHKYVSFLSYLADKYE